MAAAATAAIVLGRKMVKLINTIMMDAWKWQKWKNGIPN
jgi:hypothetical protein